MPRLEWLLIAATSILVLAGFVWTLIQILPNDALPGPDHPDYAARLAVAPDLTADNRRFSSEAYARAGVKNEPLVEEIAASHPDLTPEAVDEVRRIYAVHARDALDDLKTETERYYARIYTVADMEMIRDKRIPKISLTRLRLLLTTSDGREELARIRQEVRDRTAARYEAEVLPALKALGVTPPG